MGFDFTTLFWAAGILAILILMMRWVFAPSKRPHTGRPQTGPGADTGLLVPVLQTSRSTALASKDQLIARGVRASVSRLAVDSYQVMVFRTDAERAGEILRPDR
ncbi:MAG TPA: hypothetical protein VHO01_09745 [Jatrophihabitans sp.]|nr:hypothetical protein [Jatrophihabitans sp.]